MIKLGRYFLITELGRYRKKIIRMRRRWDICSFVCLLYEFLTTPIFFPHNQFLQAIIHRVYKYSSKSFAFNATPRHNKRAKIDPHHGFSGLYDIALRNFRSLLSPAAYIARHCRAVISKINHRINYRIVTRSSHPRRKTEQKPRSLTLSLARRKIKKKFSRQASYAEKNEKTFINHTVIPPFKFIAAAAALLL